MSTFRRFTGFLLVLMTLMVAGSAHAEYRLYKRDTHERLSTQVRDAEKFVREMLDAADTKLPRSVLRKAHGVFVLRTFKAGFIIGGRGGNGVALRRDAATNEWSPPVFVHTAQLSIGFQAGAETVESIIVILNPKGLRMLEQSKMKLGVGGGLAVGPYGRDAHLKIGPNVAMVSYSRAMGLFGGVDIEGGAVMRDDDKNHRFYRDRSLSVRDILWSGNVSIPPAAQGLVDLLTEASAN